MVNWEHRGKEYWKRGALDKRPLLIHNSLHQCPSVSEIGVDTKNSSRVLLLEFLMFTSITHFVNAVQTVPCPTDYMMRIPRKSRIILGSRKNSNAYLQDCSKIRQIPLISQNNSTALTDSWENLRIMVGLLKHCLTKYGNSVKDDRWILHKTDTT